MQWAADRSNSMQHDRSESQNRIHSQASTLVIVGKKTDHSMLTLHCSTTERVHIGCLSQVR
jgi:hypothetical protein